MSCNNTGAAGQSAAHWGSLQFERRRTSRFSGYLWKADGETGHALGLSNELQFDIFRDDGDTPILRIRSDGTTPGGSYITIVDTAAPAEFTLVMGQTDAANLPLQTLAGELSVEEPSEPINKLTTAAYGDVAIVRTAALV